jgi:hypothetical protein
MEKYKNVWLDLTPGVEMYYNFDKDISFWRDFFIKYSDRIIFGTDSNTIKSINCALNREVYKKLTQSADGYEGVFYGTKYMLKGLELPKETVDNICFKNYLSRMGERKEVNVILLKEYAEKIISDITNQPDDDYYKRGMEVVSHLKEDPYQRVAIVQLEEILKNI